MTKEIRIHEIQTGQSAAEKFDWGFGFRICFVIRHSGFVIILIRFVRAVTRLESAGAAKRVERFWPLRPSIQPRRSLVR